MSTPIQPPYSEKNPNWLQDSLRALHLFREGLQFYDTSLQSPLPIKQNRLRESLEGILLIIRDLISKYSSETSISGTEKQLEMDYGSYMKDPTSEQFAKVMSDVSELERQCALKK